MAHSLVVNLQSAKAADSRGDQTAVQGKVKAYVNELSAQTGKGITRDDAKVLESLSEQLK